MVVSVDASIEARLDQVESRIAIEELLASYAHGFDLEDPELLRSIWHEDAVFDLGDPFGSFTGIDAIMVAVAGFWQQMAWMNHWMATPAISISADRANGVVGVNCMVTETEQGPVHTAGTYYDEYERRDGVWKFAARRFELHFWTPVQSWKPDFGKQI
jgi:hypothetical protein